MGTISVVPSGKGIGADVSGVDLSTELSEATVKSIVDAWSQNLVLRFRGQKLSDPQLERFSSRLGVPDRAPVYTAGTEVTVKSDFVTVISNVLLNGKPIGDLGNSEALWHTDMSYNDIPPMASALYALEIPSAGGETGFCNMYAAYENLPPALKKRVETLQCKHDASRNSTGGLRRGMPADTTPRDAPGAVHPMVYTHPVTGRNALFLGRRLFAYIPGLEPAESEALLDEIWAHATKPEYTWYQVWQVGDLILWDNRCVMHRRNEFDAAERRIMHRTQLAGTKPVYARAPAAAQARVTTARTRRVEMNKPIKPKMIRALALACSVLACAPGVSLAQEKYPSRPVEVLVPWGPGGGSDQTARFLAKHLEAELKSSFPVVNVPGASGVTGTQKLLLNPADGYSLAVSGDYYVIIGSPTAKWKLDDFVPVAIAINQSGAIFVAENSRFKSWADVEKEARAKPNTIKLLIAGYGIIDEIHANYLATKGIKLVVVPFANPSERYVSILGGHSELLYEQAGDVKSYLQNKQMRPLLSFTDTRFHAYPDVPTSKELGYDVVTPQVRWVYMKAGTDPQRVKVISDALTKMSRTPEYQAYLKEEFAAPNSFVPASEARQYLQKMLDGVRKEATSAGLKTKQ